MVQSETRRIYFFSPGNSLGRRADHDQTKLSNLLTEVSRLSNSYIRQGHSI